VPPCSNSGQANFDDVPTPPIVAFVEGDSGSGEDCSLEVTRIGPPGKGKIKAGTLGVDREFCEGHAATPSSRARRSAVLSAGSHGINELLGNNGHRQGTRKHPCKGHEQKRDTGFLAIMTHFPDGIIRTIGHEHNRLQAHIHFRSNYTIGDIQRYLAYCLKQMYDYDETIHVWVKTGAEGSTEKKKKKPKKKYKPVVD
jgi:hypothetical protein